MLHTKLILQAGGANGRGLVLRSLQVCASIPGQQGGAGAQHSHLGWRSGWLALHLGGRRLGGLAENLLKTVGHRRRGPSQNWSPARCPPTGPQEAPPPPPRGLQAAPHHHPGLLLAFRPCSGGSFSTDPAGREHLRGLKEEEGVKGQHTRS